MDNITVKVWTQHAASPGIEAYAAEAFTAEFSLDGHADHAQLAAANLVAYLPKMYAGDRISVQVDQPHRGRIETYSFLGKAEGVNEHEQGEGSFGWAPNLETISRWLER